MRNTANNVRAAGHAKSWNKTTTSVAWKTSPLNSPNVCQIKSTRSPLAHKHTRIVQRRTWSIAGTTSNTEKYVVDCMLNQNMLLLACSISHTITIRNTAQLDQYCCKRKVRRKSCRDSTYAHRANQNQA